MKVDEIKPLNKLRLVKVHARGDQAKEFVELKVLEDCNLADYLVLDTTYNAEKNTITKNPSNKLRHVHWFARKDVKKGDAIYLRTCAGTASTQTQPNDTTIYTLYWGLKEPIWNDEGDKAVLIQITRFETLTTS
jgi:hypothetical protein